MPVNYATPLTEQEQTRLTATRTAELNVFPQLSDEDLNVARSFSSKFGSDFPVCQAIVGLLVRVAELEQQLAARSTRLQVTRAGKVVETAAAKHNFETSSPWRNPFFLSDGSDNGDSGSFEMDEAAEAKNKGLCYRCTSGSA